LPRIAATGLPGHTVDAIAVALVSVLVEARLGRPATGLADSASLEPAVVVDTLAGAPLTNLTRATFDTAPATARRVVERVLATQAGTAGLAARALLPRCPFRRVLLAHTVSTHTDLVLWTEISTATAVARVELDGDAELVTAGFVESAARPGAIANASSANLADTAAGVAATTVCRVAV